MCRFNGICCDYCERGCDSNLAIKIKSDDDRFSIKIIGNVPKDKALKEVERVLNDIFTRI